MMSEMPIKRDNAYFLERLRKEHPGIYADLQAGRFKNANAAFIAAGLRKQRTGLDVLRSAWDRASATEKDAFRRLIGCTIPGTSGSITAPTMTTPMPSTLPQAGQPIRQRAIHVDGCLEPDVKSHITAVMAHRGMKMGDLMSELGFKRLDASVGMALHQGSRINNPTLLQALGDWIEQNPLPT